MNLFRRIFRHLMVISLICLSWPLTFAHAAKLDEALWRRSQNSDFYIRLGVVRGATPEALKAALKLVRSQSHPDRYSSEGAGEVARATKAFAAFEQAYGVLSDPNQRIKWEREFYGSKSSSGQNSGSGAQAHAQKAAKPSSTSQGHTKSGSSSNANFWTKAGSSSNTGSWTKTSGGARAWSWYAKPDESSKQKPSGSQKQDSGSWARWNQENQSNTREQAKAGSRSDSQNRPNNFDDIRSAQFTERLDTFLRLNTEEQRQVVVALAKASKTIPWAALKLIELYREGPGDLMKATIIVALGDSAKSSEDVRTFLIERLKTSEVLLEKVAAARSLESAINLKAVQIALGDTLIRNNDLSLRKQIISVFAKNLENEIVRLALATLLAGSTSEEIRNHISKIFLENSDRMYVRTSFISMFLKVQSEASVGRLIDVMAGLRMYDDVEMALFDKYEKSSDAGVRRLVTSVLNTPRGSIDLRRRGPRCEGLFTQ